MVALNFDANTVEPSEPRDVLPDCKPPAMITASEMKNCGPKAKDPTGQFLSLEWTIIDGQFKGRKVWSNLNLVNKNPQAVEIAYRDLSAIARAVGVMQVVDSAALHNKPCIIDIRRSADGKGNQIKGYLPMQQAAPAVNAPFGSPAPAAPFGQPQAPAAQQPAPFGAPPAQAATPGITPPWR